MRYLVTKTCIAGALVLRFRSTLDTEKTKDITPDMSKSLVARGVLIAESTIQAPVAPAPSKSNKPKTDKGQGVAIPMWGYNPADLARYSIEELNAIILDNMEKAKLMEEYNRNQLIYVHTDREAAIIFMSKDFKPAVV